MSNLQLLASWTGLLGGAGGFIALLLQFWKNYHEFPRVKVNCSYAFLMSNSRKYLSIEVTNVGGKSINIQNVGVNFNKEFHSPFTMFYEGERMGEDFPSRLEAYSQKSWLVSFDSLKLAVNNFDRSKRVTAYVTLATGKKLTSPKILISS